MRKKCANMWSKTHKEKSQLEKGILRHTSTSLTLPLSTTKNPGYYISNKLQTERYRKPERKVKKKRLKGGEKGDRLEEDKCQIPWVFFLTHIQTMLKKLATRNSKWHLHQQQKATTKAFSNQRTKKGAA